MSEILFQQDGASGTMIALGARVHLSFDGPTTTWAWSFTAQPATSLATMLDASTGAASFDPDAFGVWTIQLIDDGANVFTLTLTANAPVGQDIIQQVDDVHGRAYYMPDAFGIPGFKIGLWGQNTTSPGLGGQAELAAGISDAGTYGVVLSERALGNPLLTYQIAQFFANQGTQSQMGLVGGSAGQFTFDGSTLSILDMKSGDELVIDAQNDIFLRTNLGAPMTMLRISGSSLGFYGNAPVVRPNVTGSRVAGVALTNLLAALDSLGIITDSTTP